MQQSTDYLNQFEIVKHNRRKLLPWWMKFFCWFFMITGVSAIGCLLLGLLGIPENLALYGFETNQPFSLTAITIIIIAIFKGVTAFSLWCEKDYAIKLGIIDAIVGMITCLIFITVLPSPIQNFQATIRLGLVLLIPYIIRLRNIQPKWNQ